MVCHNRNQTFGGSLKNRIFKGKGGGGGGHKKTNIEGELSDKGDLYILQI